MIYHGMPARGAIIKKTKDASMYEDAENREHVHCWWDFKLAQPLQKALWMFLKILKLDPSYGVARPLQVQRKFKGNEVTTLKSNLHFCVHYSIVYQDMETI